MHERLSRHVGRTVRLAREDDVPHFDEADLHLLTTSSLALMPLAPFDHWEAVRALAPSGA